MTKTGTRALIAATVFSTGLGSAVVAPAAGAQEASFQVTGDGVTDADLNDLLTTLDSMEKLAETLNAAGASSTDGTAAVSDLQVILDPLEALSSAISVVPPGSLIDADLSDIVSTVRMSPVRGETADGRTVVFPTSGRFTSGYGARGGATHEGIDIADPIGTPVLAVMDGKVISSGPANGFGKWVRLKHDDGSVSVYGHVNTVDVPLGRRVTAGEQIATLGNEGRSTGPHLHFEIRPGGNDPADPVDWFAQQGIDVS